MSARSMSNRKNALSILYRGHSILPFPTARQRPHFRAGERWERWKRISLSQVEPEFDLLSDEYDELLRDPIRDRFTSGAAEFFHLRKRDLIRDYFRRRQMDSRRLNYLDLGCGKGELLAVLRDDFAHVSGCDPSPRMLEAGRLSAEGIPIRIQREDGEIPFDNAQFDFVTAVCVYHHVPPPLRDRLTAEVRRVLKPGGIFAIVEHNPYNPVTRL